MRSGRFVIAGVTAAWAIGSIPAHAATLQVIIDKLAFAPAEVAAHVGDTIEWVNKDPLAHSATAKGHWDVLLPAGKTAILVVHDAGSFEYYCRFHPNMKGRLTVTPK